MSESMIKTGVGGTAFAGPDAVALFRVTALRHGLRLYAQCGIKPNRAWTPTAMLKAAGEVTGKRYPRGAYLAAAEDLKTWADAMAAALPVEVDNG